MHQAVVVVAGVAATTATVAEMTPQQQPALASVLVLVMVLVLALALALVRHCPQMCPPQRMRGRVSCLGSATAARLCTVACPVAASAWTGL